MNPIEKQREQPKGTFSTWTTNYDGTTKEVGLYRSRNGTVEKKLFTSISAAMRYGFSKNYHHRSGITFSAFLNGCINDFAKNVGGDNV